MLSPSFTNLAGTEEMATCPDVSNLPVAGHEARSGRCGSLHTMGKSCRPRDESVGSPKTSTTVRMARTCAPSIEEGVEDNEQDGANQRQALQFISTTGSGYGGGP